MDSTAGGVVVGEAVDAAVEAADGAAEGLEVVGGSVGAREEGETVGDGGGLSVAGTVHGHPEPPPARGLPSER